MNIPSIPPNSDAANNALRRKLLPSIGLNLLLPMLSYSLVRPHVSSDTMALAIGAAIPVVVTLVEFVIQRRLNPIGVAAVCTFGVALAAAVLSGGNALVLKLHDAMLSGPLGLAFLISAMLGRPLLLVFLRFGMRQSGVAIPALSGPRAALMRRPLSVLSAIIGAMLFVHAMVILALALTLPTDTFVTVGRPASWIVIAAGTGAIMWYRRGMRARVARSMPGAGTGFEPG